MGHRDTHRAAAAPLPVEATQILRSFAQRLGETLFIKGGFFNPEKTGEFLNKRN